MAVDSDGVFAAFERGKELAIFLRERLESRLESRVYCNSDKPIKQSNLRRITNF